MTTAVSTKVVQQNRTRQCRKVLRVVRVHGHWLRLKVFSATKKETAKTNEFMPYRSLTFLVKKRLDPRSIKAKLFLPTIPIGIVTYAFTLFWDNLCRNSCIYLSSKVKVRAQKNPWENSKRSPRHCLYMATFGVRTYLFSDEMKRHILRNQSTLLADHYSSFWRTLFAADEQEDHPG